MTETTILEWLNTPAKIPDNQARQTAQARQAQLTKPSGSLGRIEEIAIQLAALQNTTYPSVEHVQITVFAGDHGIAVEGVSAFPQIVTNQMISNFISGGAAISVLAHTLGTQLEIINLGTAHDIGMLEGVVHYQLGPGTANFLHAPAMTSSQLAKALNAGRQAIDRAQKIDTQLFIGGEMGIANTTSATTLACVLLDIAPSQLAGPGTGLNSRGVAHKIEVIENAIALHHSQITSPLEALRRVGGFEIAALTGAYIRCAQLGIPALVDGFICSVAALTAVHLYAGMKDWLLFSHLGAEPGHRLILEALDVQPLVNLGLRLGEGSGAAITLPLLRLACTLHNDMSTFAEAKVSQESQN